jgi:hypothetical protein
LRRKILSRKITVQVSDTTMSKEELPVVPQKITCEILCSLKYFLN